VKGDAIARSQRQDYEPFAGSLMREGDLPLTNRDRLMARNHPPRAHCEINVL
jgi:hypothetical protein